MTIIDSSTVVVYNHDELKTILENENTYTYVYLGADIDMTGGIKILSSKSEVTIDGTYLDVRYTLTQYSSSAYTNTIYVAIQPSNINVTVQNLDIVGKNYYGVICIYDANIYGNVMVNYINIDYTGPQLAFNPYSSLVIKDSNITIASEAGTSPANEVAETRNVTLGGNVNMTSSSDYAIFWVRHVVAGENPFINVLPNSNISITHTNDALYLISSASYCNMTFGSNSSTNIYVAEGMGGANTNLAHDVLIDSDASVTIEQSSRYLSYSTWNINGEFRMNSGSSLKMISDYVGVAANYSIRFVSNTASIYLNNPKSLVLYNASTNAITSTVSIPFYLNIPQYNRWTTITPLISAGNIDDIPTYSWYKIEDVTNLVVSGNMTSSATTITDINLTPAEESDLPSLNQFLLNNTRVLSMGRPSLTLNPITDISDSISGMTVPNADIKISYGGNDYFTTADSNGNFNYTAGTLLPIGTEISFIANLAGSFLYRFRTVEVVFDGDLTIILATGEVTFEQVPFKSNPTLLKRADPLQVVVDDSRITPTVWNLYASIDNELTNSAGNILTEGLVFVDDLDNMTVLSNNKTLVYTSDGVTSGETIVSWPDVEGILLQLNIVPIVKDTTYRANINWYIE